MLTEQFSGIQQLKLHLQKLQPDTKPQTGTYDCIYDFLWTCLQHSPQFLHTHIKTSASKQFKKSILVL